MDARYIGISIKNISCSTGVFTRLVRRLMDGNYPHDLARRAQEHPMSRKSGTVPSKATGTTTGTKPDKGFSVWSAKTKVTCTGVIAISTGL